MGLFLVLLALLFGFGFGVFAFRVKSGWCPNCGHGLDHGPGPVASGRREASQ
jgi:hypothetical protein